MITIQKKALETADDAGEQVAPSVGDSIDLGGVTAKVVADGGHTLDLDIETVGGLPIVDQGAADQAADDADTTAVDDSAISSTVASKTGGEAEQTRLMRAAARIDKRRGL